MKKISKSFCWRPFTEIYMNIPINTYKPCCRFTLPKNMNTMDTDLHADVRQAILNNRWHPGCISCQTLEENGSKNTHRTQYIGPRDPTLIKDNRFLPKILDIRLGSTCNLACIICNEQNSSKWYSENRRMSADKNENISVEADVPTDKKLWASVEEIVLHGGEPMYMKSMFKLMDWLIDENLAGNIKIRLYTNGTIINQNIIERLLKFRKVDIGFSIDAVNDRFYTVRWPGNWSEVRDNFLQVSEHKNIDTSVNYTYSLINSCFFVDDIDCLLKEFGDIEIGVNALVNPEYYQAKHLPDHVKNKLITDYDKHFITRQCIPLLQTPGSPDRLQVAIEKLQQLDKYRNTNSKTLFTDDLHYLFD